MSHFKNFLMEKEGLSVENKIIAFFKKQKNPPDKEIHAFANKEGIDEHKFEEIIYKIFSRYVSIGKHFDMKDDEFGSEELKKGIKIESEHTDFPEIAKQIAKDHLAEIPDYYTRLIKMEEEAKEKKD